MDGDGQPLSVDRPPHSRRSPEARRTNATPYVAPGILTYRFAPKHRGRQT